MSDGGGTVAGESPDKAEQRESAVGGDGKDPRLSVLRDRVDEPTAVFRALAPRTAPEDEPEAPESRDEAAEDVEDVEDAGKAVNAETESAEASEPSDSPKAEDAAGGETVADEAEGTGAEPVADAPGTEPATAETKGETEGEAEGENEDEAEGEGKGEEAEASEAAGAAEAAEASETAEAAPAKPVDQPTAVFNAFAPRNAQPKPAQPAPAPESKPEVAKPEVAKPEAAKPEGASEGTPEPALEAEPAPPVDQPTAVFKAFTPPQAKPVDQPTTALKLPPSTFRPLQGDITQEQPKPARPKPEEPGAVAPTPAPAPAPVPASLAEPERTRQQPLPPRPPLEILAELTNTPPPPETPLRTTFRRLKIWTPLVLLLLVVFAVVQFVRPLPDPKLVLSADPTYTFEGGPLQMPWPSEGQGAAEVEGVGSLGTYGPQKPAPIASVAKTMTAYVILRDHPIKGNADGPEIEVDRTAGEQAKAKDESTAPIKEGQTYSEKELLQLLMIPSGNNVARLLARWDAGSEAAFVDKMNAAAKELGMTGSTYTDPSGLQSTTVSTPLDQLKLAKAVMQYDVFREIVDMPNVTIDGIPTRIENNNTILLEPGVTGIKTGSSTPAGGNLLWAANTVVDGQKRRILGIVMGAKDAPQLYQKLDLAIANSLKVIQKAQADVTSAAVVTKGQVVGYVDDGLGGRTPVVSTKDLKAVGWPGLKVSLRLGDGGKKPPHAAKAGDVVGQVSIGTGTGAVSAPVALAKDLVEPGFYEKLTRLG
ncbi:D-alanyl-D-alanine carboxypeptidase [Streptomyces sp. NPDC015232]|uniref:D-alanyl-D-alanine carboxypeptidase family protein n=1 Tax=unclassified Streptomyces TaxID=2593676 RepID=UPI0036FC7F62